MEVSKKPFTFTLKNDFNMTGFLLKAKPDEAFRTKTELSKKLVRTNTTSNVKLKNNIDLTQEDVEKLIEAGRKTLIYYEANNRLDAYNYPDEFELLDLVVKY